MAEFSSVNYALAYETSPFCLSNRGTNNAEILVKHDSFIVPDSGLAVNDTIKLIDICKCVTICGAEIWVRDALGGAAEVQLGFQANGKDVLADDPDGLIASAPLTATTVTESTDGLYKGLRLEEDIQPYLTVLGALDAADAGKKIEVKIYYINE